MKTIIIGGVAGGATAAARLRRLDEKAEIIILERGEYVSFANCGLPYYIGGVITDREDLTLQTPQSFKARFNIDVRVLNEAVKVSPDAKPSPSKIFARAKPMKKPTTTSFCLWVPSRYARTSRALTVAMFSPFATFPTP